MKKLLVLVLSVIMVLSVMPVAYAKPATYSPEIEQYIEAYVRACTYAWSVYETDEQRCVVETIINETDKELAENTYIDGMDYNELINIEAEGRIDEITALSECFNKAIDKIEKKIADGELVLVVDVYELFFKYFWYIDIYYSHKDWTELFNRAENFKSDKFINAQSQCDIGLEIIDEMMFSNIGTQAEYDAALEMIKPYVNSICSCLDGNHPYGEYISDNNATEEADGTKTATCEFCGATDTIVDEGTKLPKEKASLLEMIFDLIKDFFSLILSVFK